MRLIFELGYYNCMVLLEEKKCLRLKIGLIKKLTLLCTQG